MCRACDTHASRNRNIDCGYFTSANKQHIVKIWDHFYGYRDIYQRHMLISFWLQFHSTHWGRLTQLCVSKLTTIGSDNGVSPGRHQDIIWTHDGILLIGDLGTKISAIVIEIQTISFWKNRWKVSSGKWWPIRLGLNVFWYDNFKL